MIYYIPLLKLKNFDIKIIEKLDKVFVKETYTLVNKFSTSFIASQIGISESEAFNLLLECVNIGVVNLHYELICPNCNNLVSESSNYGILINNITSCNNCATKDIVSDNNIYYYFTLLLGKKAKVSENESIKEMIKSKA